MVRQQFILTETAEVFIDFYDLCLDGAILKGQKTTFSLTTIFFGKDFNKFSLLFLPNVVRQRIRFFKSIGLQKEKKKEKEMHFS